MSDADTDFQQRLERYEARIRRFVEAHDGKPMGDVLIELERRERWPQIMGHYADLLPVPDLAELLAKEPPVAAF